MNSNEATNDRADTAPLHAHFTCINENDPFGATLGMAHFEY